MRVGVLVKEHRAARLVVRWRLPRRPCWIWALHVGYQAPRYSRGSSALGQRSNSHVHYEGYDSVRANTSREHVSTLIYRLLQRVINYTLFIIHRLHNGDWKAEQSISQNCVLGYFYHHDMIIIETLSKLFIPPEKKSLKRTAKRLP